MTTLLANNTESGEPSSYKHMEHSLSTTVSKAGEDTKEKNSDESFLSKGSENKHVDGADEVLLKSKTESLCSNLPHQEKKSLTTCQQNENEENKDVRGNSLSNESTQAADVRIPISQSDLKPSSPVYQYPPSNKKSTTPCQTIVPDEMNPKPDKSSPQEVVAKIPKDSERSHQQSSSSDAIAGARPSPDLSVSYISFTSLVAGNVHLLTSPRCLYSEEVGIAWTSTSYPYSESGFSISTSTIPTSASSRLAAPSSRLC